MVDKKKVCQEIQDTFLEFVWREEIVLITQY
jgi:hypothetical protein